MRYRRLGQTELVISEIGFGGWGLGMDLWRGVDESTCRDAVVAALELGVNFYDTALAYGWGVGEQILASETKAATECGSAVIATKVPPLNDEWPARGNVRLREAFPVEHIRQCVRRSLKNVSAETLMLVQLHVWHDNWLRDPDWPKMRAEMESMKAAGQVKHWGVSINDHAPETAIRLLEDELIETAQFIYNIYDRSAERELFAVARDRDLGLIARVPFDEGSLTATLRPDSKFPEGDWRTEYFSGDRLQEVVDRGHQLMQLGCHEADSLAELALRFCLSRPEISTVIPGMRRRRHVVANTAVSDGRYLTEELLQKLAEYEWPRNWYY